MRANIKNTFQTIADLKRRLDQNAKLVEPTDLYSAVVDYSIDHESYVKKLTVALAGKQAQVDDAEPIAGMRMLAYMQREGVFGISPQGRCHSVIDFLKIKSFEYEMEQRQLNVDEFLRETEVAIYDILARGNASQITKSLLEAAEAVNEFRNQRARSSDEFTDAP